MVNEAKSMLDGYTHWLKEKTVLCRVRCGWVQATTPHLDCHNDYLQIYIRKDAGGYILTAGLSLIAIWMNQGGKNCSKGFCPVLERSWMAVSYQ